MLLMMLSSTSLLAATKTQKKVLGTIYKTIQLNSNYDTGNNWWSYQIYNKQVDVNLTAYKDDWSNLVLTFKVYIENLDHPGDVSFLEQSTCFGFLEVGTDPNGSNNITWDPKKLNLKEGWNDVEVSFKTSASDPVPGRYNAEKFTLADHIKYFRLCFARMKTNDAFLMRLADVCIRDKSQTEEVVDEENPGYETNYDVCSLPLSFDATVSKSHASYGWPKVFDTTYDVSKHNLKQLYLAFDAEITLNDGADINTITNGVGQIELTSGGKADVHEATLGLNSVDWKPGKHTYYVPLSSATSTGGGIDWSAINYMRIYLTSVSSEMVGSIHWSLNNVHIVDFTTKTSLPTIFSDGMMFQQNKPMNIWGYGTEGKKIKVLLSKNGTQIATKETTIGTDGKWTIAFDAQKGSYDKYSFTAYENDEAFQTVKDVLVGEVWLSGGQSNMALTVGGLQIKDEVLAEANNENIRFFMEPLRPTGTTSPYVPEKDVPGAKWGYGNNPSQVANVSAVAYLTIKELQKKLDVPVGFLNTAIGGSIIEAWLSRDVIEAPEYAEMKTTLNRRGMYFDKNFWVDADVTMTGFYNAKIGPLAGFNIAGALWYQGESNSDRPELYGQELKMLKEAWSNTFGFAKGEMPFFYNGIATWITETASPYWLGLTDEAMEDGFKLIGDAKTGYYPIYDTNYDYTGNVVIHPTDKRGVASHHATAIYNMVYGNEGKEYVCPMKESITENNGKLVVKFNHVGTGLKTTDGLTDVHGFSIADEDGIYVGANAKITGTDEVTVWNEGVKNPKNVNYAFCSFNMTSNLANSENFPASPFRSDRSINYETLEGKNEMKNNFYNPQAWTYADAETTWEASKEKKNYFGTITDYYTGFMPAWTTNPVAGADKGTITFDTDVKAEGKASLKLAYTAAGAYGVGPETGYQSRIFQFGNFKTISVMVKNADAREKTLQLSFKSGDAVYTAEPQTVKTSSEFETVTFDLSTLKDAQDAVVADAASVLKAATDVQFTVTDNAAGTVYLDNVMFGTYDADALVDGEIRVVGKDGDKDIVKIRKDLKGGEWNVITLPFQINKVNKTDFATYFGEGAKIGCLGVGAKVSGNLVCYSPRDYTGDMVAGRPYFIKPVKDVKVIITMTRTVTNTQATSAKDENDKNYVMNGTLAAKTIRTTDCLLKGDGTFYYPTAEQTNVKALSGYFTFPADVDITKLSIEDVNVATGITDVTVAGANLNAKIYTLDGQYVGTDTQSLPKGVYVIDNKKVVVK